MSVMQLSVEEIDQIISFLQEPYQEPYPYELISRLEQLKTETQFYIQLENKILTDKMDEEHQRHKQGGYGSSPVSNAYFKFSE